MWTTKVEDKGEMHGSDIHINNNQVRSQTFKKHFAPSWTILFPRKSSSSLTLNIYNLLTSTWIQKGHRPFQHGPCPQRVHSHETGKQSLGENRESPWNPGSRWKHREMGQLSEGRADWIRKDATQTMSTETSRNRKWRSQTWRKQSRRGHNLARKV